MAAAPPDLRARAGPFVRVTAATAAQDVFVSAYAVCAIVGSPVNPQQCRVYVSTPSMGGGHVLAWDAPTEAWLFAQECAAVLEDWARWCGRQEELGRLQALDVDPREETD
jgi:hypothetical protein